MELILKGVPVCPGITSGIARVLKDVRTIPDVEDGCILVMPFFTPMASIAISRANGVLADFGGTTSHAASIAREFNVPCIVGLADASTKIKDGDTIYMDGNSGEVYEI